MAPTTDRRDAESGDGMGDGVGRERAERRCIRTRIGAGRGTGWRMRERRTPDVAGDAESGRESEPRAARTPRLRQSARATADERYADRTRTSAAPARAVESLNPCTDESRAYRARGPRL